jgi:pimeloyl-ACP methyl ester carboxylesterase
VTPAYRWIETNGVRLRAVVEGDGPLVVLVHGFPESWYSWRHQIGPLAGAGYRVCAIDVRGYGGSDKPARVEDYAMEALTGDVAGVIAALQPERPAVIIGHDWGASIVWHTALAHPERVAAVAALSVPYLGRGPAPFIDLVRLMFTQRGRFFYQVYFQDEDVAEAELEADVGASLRRFLYAISGDAPEGAWPCDKPHGARLLDRLADPDPFPAWLGPEDLAFYVRAFEAAGFRGPLNRYRNHRRDWEWAAQFEDRPISQPACFIGGERDLVLKMLPGVDMMEAMRAKVSDLRRCAILPGCGHWTQQERPAETTSHLLEWLSGLRL